MRQPLATQAHTTVRLTLPAHLVHELAAQRGIHITSDEGALSGAHMTLLYGLKGCTRLQEEHRIHIQQHLREARVLSVDVLAPVLFVKPDMHTLAFLLNAPRLEELRADLLATFPDAQDPYRHSGWVPHVTLAHLKPGKSWQFLSDKRRRWGAVALPIVSFEIHRADGPVEVLTPLGDLTAYR